MRIIAVNYNYTPTWIPEYTDDYLIYDRSDSKEWLKDFPQDKIIYTQNVGNVDFDKLSYIVDNYEQLPESFLWIKTNLFKYISLEEFNLVKDNKTFTPLLTQHHRTYSDDFGVVCYYDENGIYHERNDSWFLSQHPGLHINRWEDWAHHFQLPSPRYIPFAPGGNYILTRETIHKYGIDYYARMASTLPYCQLPGEAHCAERSYYLMWK